MDAAATTEVWDPVREPRAGQPRHLRRLRLRDERRRHGAVGRKGKALGLPLYRLLGGAARPVPAYAGGFALGYAAPAAVTEEALAQVALGYRAVKLRLGDSLYQ